MYRQGGIWGPSNVPLRWYFLCTTKVVFGGLFIVSPRWYLGSVQCITKVVFLMYHQGGIWGPCNVSLRWYFICITKVVFGVSSMYHQGGIAYVSPRWYLGSVQCITKVVFLMYHQGGI